MQDNSNNPQLNQLVSFIQHDLPGMEAGQYELNVSQQVKEPGSKADEPDRMISDDSLQKKHRFAVMGDRFWLQKPMELLYSVFPPENAAGKYSTVLPSVVFTKSTFPWSRHLGGSPKQDIKPGKDTDQDVPTWLTILLVDEDDYGEYVTTYDGLTLEPRPATIGDLFSPNAIPDSSLGDHYSYFNSIRSSGQIASVMDPGDQLSDPIQILDIPLTLFWKIAPTQEDLEVMAHVRKVSLINKPTMPGISDVGEPEGSFSIVFGNRLPADNRKTTAFLVSLENLEDFLPTEEGEAKAAPKLDGKKMLRLAVLKSWRFSSTGQNASFVERMMSLNGAVPMVDQEKIKSSNSDLSVNTDLRLAAQEQALPIVKNALSMGYVPLNHHLRTAEDNSGKTLNKTVSWYRGPCIPYLTKRPSIRLPVSSPDKVTIFDPTTGMLDTSYAAAWSLGRHLALQDKSFSTALYQWKRGVSKDILNRVENEILATHIGAAFSAVPVKDSQTEVRSRGLGPQSKAPQPLPSPQFQPGDLMRRAILLTKKK